MALVSTLVLGGCATPGSQDQDNTAPPFRDAAMRADDAERAIKPGISTRVDVQTALGNANVVLFESGYEVWVYRSAGAEFVVLFQPGGLVKKTRIRPKTA